MHPKIERKTINGKKVTGHWVGVTVHNAGSNVVDTPSAKLACINKSPTSQANELVESLDQGLNSGESYKFNFFVTRKITQLCRNSFEITLPNDEVEFNNKARVKINNNSIGHYYIRHY